MLRMKTLNLSKELLKKLSKLSNKIVELVLFIQLLGHWKKSCQECICQLLPCIDTVVREHIKPYCSILGNTLCPITLISQHLVYLINKHLRIFLNLWFMKLREIHPSEVPHSSCHHTHIWVHGDHNLPIGLSCYGFVQQLKATYNSPLLNYSAKGLAKTGGASSNLWGASR